MKDRRNVPSYGVDNLKTPILVLNEEVKCFHNLLVKIRYGNSIANMAHFPPAILPSSTVVIAKYHLEQGLRNPLSEGTMR